MMMGETVHTNTTPSSSAVTLMGLFRRFKKRISLTLFLVLGEAILDILFPLFIGFAINGLLEKDYLGVTALAVLGILSLLVGSGRRFYDTRAYAGIYRTLMKKNRKIKVQTLARG